MPNVPAVLLCFACLEESGSDSPMCVAFHNFKPKIINKNASSTAWISTGVLCSVNKSFFEAPAPNLASWQRFVRLLLRLSQAEF
jgi:hypothetical protein